MSLLRRISPDLPMQKVSSALLGNDPNTYETDLHNLLLRQHPFLGEYAVAVEITQQDATSGYLYGIFKVSPAVQADPTTRAPVRVPIVVRNRKPFPFDVFLTGEGIALPLTETRVNVALHAAASGGVRVAPKAELPSQMQEDNFAPPNGGSNGYGGTIKEGSALDALFHYLPPELCHAVALSSHTDPWLRAKCDENPSFAASMVKLAMVPAARPPQAEDGLSVASAVLTRGDDGQYHVLSALRTPEGLSFTDSAVEKRAEANLPQELRHAALRGGFVPLTHTEPNALPLVRDTAGALSKLASVVQPGYYRVIEDGVEKRAFVQPSCRTLAGRTVPQALVLTDDRAAMQYPAPLGVPVSTASLYADAQGVEKRAGKRGVFVLPDGTVYEPVSVQRTSHKEDGTEFVVRGEVSGDTSTVKLAAVAGPVQYGDRSVMLPRETVFLSLPEDRGVGRFVHSVEKVASVLNAESRIGGLRLEHTGGDRFELRDTGGRVLLKTAQAADALLALLALGDSTDGAIQKLSAAKQGPVQFHAKNSTESFRYSPREKTASRIDVSGIRTDLVKVAALLPAGDTVDAVLSLSFVTDENAAKYVALLPDFEESVSKLARLLLAARIGLPEVQEGAISSAMNGLEKAIQGLKRLDIRASLSS